ncbi:hypothetical protein [Nocardiopsis prasina]|uniref:hypothetical protein n=1 Tax=Nocardiopsis prasina TaxID=2015 RepID=UPI00034D823B|nr:hypothetical protein [Nocardiopsis prasina]
MNGQEMVLDADPTPPLDQAAEARRRLAAHTAPPASFWVVQAVGCTLVAGLPIWMPLLSIDARYLQWILVVVALAAAGLSWVRRRRTGVTLPRWASAYPSARRPRVVVMIVTVLGLIAIHTLVGRGQEGLALAVLGPVALASLGGYLWVHASMRRDIEDGRVRA